MFKKNFLTGLLGLAGMFLVSQLLAQNINLYDQPKSDAKVIATIDTAAGFVPIFTPKEGGWIKVGDPHNGNVGWLKSSELTPSGQTSSGFTFTQSISQNGKPMPSYVVRFGTDEESKAIIKQMQLQQQLLQKNLQKMVKDIYDNIDEAWKNFPMITPVIIVPQKEVPKTDAPKAVPKAVQTPDNVTNKK